VFASGAGSVQDDEADEIMKSLTISKGYWETVNQKQTDNTMTKENHRNDKQWFTKHCSDNWI
jgi:hypothetical protein